jgi:hypothetical protein
MMKKLYLFTAATCLLSLHSVAQTIDFEGTLQSVDTFDNGSNQSGGFTFNNIHFNNYYDTTYFYHNGFAMSSMRDSVTSGWGNQFSSITAGGYNSNTYALFAGSGSIDLTSVGNPVAPFSFKVTNSTFAALSMRDGDNFGKKFGSSTDAGGNTDGTNGEDYFILHVSGIAANGDTLNTVSVYLADFRFADDSLDYILTDWLDVDLTNLGGIQIAYLTFDFESSDVGAFGMNTPAYFIMDDFSYSATWGLNEDSKSTLSVYPNPFKEFLTLPNVKGEAMIYSSEGKLVAKKEFSANEKWNLSELSSGFYTLILNSNGRKESIKLLK